MPISSQNIGARIVVLGSLNIDRIWTVAQLPSRGQTVLAQSTRTEFGGKGANQAVAAARQGAQVALMGMVGADGDGQRYRAHLGELRIDTSAVLVHAEAATGSAHVYVDGAGENLIVVDSGANWQFDRGLIMDVLPPLLAQSEILLLQLETPLPVVHEGLHQAATCGVRSVLNASPYNPAFQWGTPIDTVIMNEHECREFFRQTPAELQALPDKGLGAFLRQYGLTNLIITQGSRPTLRFSADGVLQMPTYRVEPKDTVGAGDTFAGVLAVQLAEKEAWKEAIWRANIAAALSTLAPGAQSAMPTRDRVDGVARTAALAW